MQFEIFGKRTAWGCLLSTVVAASLSGAMLAQDNVAGPAQPTKTPAVKVKRLTELSKPSDAASPSLELPLQEPEKKEPTAKEPEKKEPAAQPARKTPETLEEFLQQGLATHPDIHAAQAQVELARANLASKRMQVTESLTKVWNAHVEAETLLRTAEAAIKNAIETRDQVRRMHEQGVVPTKELADAETLYIKSRATLDIAAGQYDAARRAIELTYLTAADPHHPPTLNVKNQKCVACHAIEPAAVAFDHWAPSLQHSHEKVVQALQGQTYRALLNSHTEKFSVPLTDDMDLASTLDQKVDVIEPFQTLGQAIEFLQFKTDLNLQDVTPLSIPKETPIRVRLKGVLKVGAIMQAIEDSYPVYFLAREYGVAVMVSQGPPQSETLVNQWLQLRRQKQQAKAEAAEQARMEQQKAQIERARMEQQRVQHEEELRKKDEEKEAERQKKGKQR